jgi:hypothetical protein
VAMSANPGHGPGPDVGAGGTGPVDAGEQLPCGRTFEAVWAAREAGRTPDDPHYAHCPHCGAALERLDVLDGFVRAARAQEAQARQAAGGGQASATGRAAEAVTQRVMGIVRRELRPGRSLPLGDGREDAWIVEAAAAKAFRAAADALPGVRAGSCRITPLDPAAPAPRTGPARGPLRVRLQVAADLSRMLPELADEIRDRVEAVADAEIGMDVRAVDVTFVDLVAPEETDGADGTEGMERA